MLIISYGIPKSGSTLTFELINGMLKSIGHPQERLPDGLVSPGHGVNFIEKVTPDVVSKLIAALPADGFICVKTHARLDRSILGQLEDLQAQRKLQVVACYRDPRDICLSLMDAGKHAREKGKKAFSECTDLKSVVPKVERQLMTFRVWGAVRGAIRLNYDVVAFATDRAFDVLEAALGIKCDREIARQHAFSDAFTQMNKGVRNRYVTDLTAEDATYLAEVFEKFIRRVIKRNDDSWFSSYRNNVLARPVENA